LNGRNRRRPSSNHTSECLIVSRRRCTSATNGRNHPDCKHQGEIAGSISTSVGTACALLKRSRAGLSWERAQGVTDAELEAMLFRGEGCNTPSVRSPVDCGHVHRELHRPGVTLQQLWSEYQESAAARRDGSNQYSHFCETYKAWRARLKPSLRRVNVGHAEEPRAAQRTSVCGLFG
jgi:hypothetical protein